MSGESEEEGDEFPGRLLHQAALWENAELLEDLLNGEFRLYIDSQDDHGRTALHAAAASPKPECVRILLLAGANPNISCSNKAENKTPLHVAAEHGNVEAMHLLLEWEADVLAKNSHGLTAMDVAEQGNHELCMQILKRAADAKEKRRQELYDALRDACSKNEINQVKTLLGDLGSEAELVINLAPGGSNTLLYKACEEGRLEMALLLLEHGSDCRIHPVTKYSPLHISCYRGHKDIVELLLQRFPELIQTTTVEQWLPIHAAVINGHSAVLDTLLKFEYPVRVVSTFRDKTNQWEYEFPFDVNAIDVSGQTVLYMACYIENKTIVELLLNFRVKAWKIESEEESKTERDGKEESSRVTTSPTKSRISDGIHALISKLSFNRSNSVEPSMKLNETMLCPVIVDAYCNEGCETALHTSVRAKNQAIVCLLLASGADPNLKMRRIDDHELDCGRPSRPLTALMEACQSHNYAMIDLLLKHGAQDDDRGALGVAMQHNDSSIVSKLLTLKTHADPEHKINRKAFDVIPATQFKAFGFVGVNSVTPSSMFPSTPVMVNWHGQQCLLRMEEQWLVDASMAHNPKLKLTPKNQGLVLLSITRLDISNNLLVELPECVFQLQSLRYLNLAQNKLERLPEGIASYELGSPKHKSPRVIANDEKCYTCPVLEEVHLQDNRLDVVPPALFHLPSLTILDLSNNKLQALPFKMWTAPKLKELNASFNLLRDLPVKLHSSSADQKLGDVDEGLVGSVTISSPYHHHPNDPVDEGPKGNAKNPAMDEGITQIPVDVPTSSNAAMNLVSRDLNRHNFWCQSVDINESYLDNDLEGHDYQSQLMMLNLAHNAFENIPHGLSCLAINLVRLNMSFNRLTNMGCVSMFPPTLKQLDLSHNQVTCWPTLKTDADSIGDVQGPVCYGNVEMNAKGTPKSYSPVCKLTKSLRGSCSSLSSLSNNSCVHQRHTRFDNLRTLILSDNRLVRLTLTLEDERMSIEDEDFHESVETSYGSQKDLLKVTVPPMKSRILFPNLSLLDVSNNCVREIPSIVAELSNLSVLNVSGNAEISHLPPEMGLLGKLWNLNTRGCNLNEPLKTMIDSKKYKTMDVVGYLKSILENAKPYARMKLMIVGVQGIGKTSLLDQLRQEGTGSYRKKPPEHWAKRMGNKNINVKTSKGFNMSTVGVDIGDWVYEKKLRGQSSHGPVTFRTWDFGGQREYYSTHQYFLSRRSLYLVVWKITDGQKGVNEILQWLVNIQARAPNSPVLIVGTHYDLVKERFPPQYSEELQQFIRDRFMSVVDADKCGLPRILDTIEVSCKTRHNVKLLCNLIYDTVFELRSPGSKERLLEQRIPATYLALEDVVGCLSLERRLQGKDPVLQSEQYKMLVMHEMQERFLTGFRDMAELNQATAFLHENGVLLHYEDATLKDLYFLDPQWLCDMLAHVVTIHEINPFARTGIMKLDDLKHIFKSSHCAPVDIKSYIVNLLNKFEVALTWDNRTLLIPSLLPTEEQLLSGLPGCDVRIPVRSRGWAMRCKAFQASKAGTYVGGSHRSEDGKKESNDDYQILHRNNLNLSIRRLLLMSYFPSGFWSRLLTRMLADDLVIEVIRSYLILPREVQQDPGMIGLLERNRAEWLCWQSGMELRYANTTLFRMKEVLPHLENGSCNYHRMRFLLQQQGSWAPMDMSTSAILELFIPNQTIVLQRRFTLPKENSEDGDETNENDSPCFQRIILDPNPDCVAKLLALAVDHIDTLLEDWYPTLGTRFVHTSEGKFLVTRLVPCPHCLIDQLKRDPPPNRFGADGEAWQLVALRDCNGEPCVLQDMNMYRPWDPHRSGNYSPRFYQRNYGSRDSTMSHDSDSGVGPDSANSSRKPSAEGQSDSEGPSAQDTNGLEAAYTDPIPDNVYSFMIEECILTAYEDKDITCPVHGELTLAQIAPDAVFLDLGDRYLIRPENVKRAKLLGRGAFGFVFKATVKYRGVANSFTEVAMKMLQPVDPGFGARQSASVAFKAAQSKWQRDPIQYACKAYCTARQELNILLSLRHPNIVPLVGVCTRPLALILELAPLGALDAMLKNYRRSGAQLQLDVLQKIIIQIAKALEYLHQQHIIYRDLKSENVLIWSLPPPFSNIANPAVDVKLADYGISRSTLPTGTKGFGGTEGFMAPEIMRYNGEEEYTEKVDCFSFGMFMYELMTLHLPFEGHESVKDHVLDGGRPSLTHRETFYPTYMLDLMVLCWSQQPKDRPSASQVVSIASAPEFVHLMDVISLEEQTAVICAASVETGSVDGSRQVDTWLSRLGQQLDILTCNARSWQNCRTLVADNVPITQICVVSRNIWLGDAKGVVHIYDAPHYTKTHSFVLEPDAATPYAVRSMCYMQEFERVAVSTSNGRLWLYAANFIPNSCDNIPENYEGHVMSELGSNGCPIHSMAYLYDATKKHCELWCGQTQGMISIFTQKETLVISQEVINHQEVIDKTDVLQIVASGESSSVWSYVYPGCVIYHWDADTRTIVNKLDCSKLVPCSESLKSISIEEHLSPGRCQVTALTNLGEHLYVGTTWGCIVVAEGATMRPVTVFRPFEEEVKAILPVLENVQQLTTPTESVHVQRKEVPVIVTIGKGYRNLLNRFTNVPMLPVSMDGALRKNMYALLWRSDNW